MKVAACDDEMIYCNQVENFLIRIGQEHGIKIQCDKYTSGLQLLKNDINQYSVIFLDIDMEDENGLQVAEKIRKENQTVELIFLTALLQYAVDGYRYRAYRFLVKPITYKDFLFQLKELIIQLISHENHTITIRSGVLEQTINIYHIMYVEVMNHNLLYHCDNKSYTVGGTMKKAEKELMGHCFSRIHNSYLINMKYVQEVKALSLIMKNGTELPISRSRRDDFRRTYLEFWGDTLG